MNRIGGAGTSNNNIDKENSALNAISASSTTATTSATSAAGAADTADNATGAAYTHEIGGTRAGNSQNAGSTGNGNANINIYYFWEQKTHVLIFYIKK